MPDGSHQASHERHSLLTHALWYRLSCHRQSAHRWFKARQRHQIDSRLYDRYVSTPPACARSGKTPGSAVLRHGNTTSNTVSGRTLVVTPSAAQWSVKPCQALVLFSTIATMVYGDRQYGWQATILPVANGHAICSTVMVSPKIYRLVSSSSTITPRPFTQRSQRIFNTFERRTKRGVAFDSW